MPAAVFDCHIVSTLTIQIVPCGILWEYVFFIYIYFTFLFHSDGPKPLILSITSIQGLDWTGEALQCLTELGVLVNGWKYLIVSIVSFRTLAYNLYVTQSGFCIFSEIIFASETKKTWSTAKTKIEVSVLSCGSWAVSDPHNSSIGCCLLLRLLRWCLPLLNVGKAESIRLINSGG